MTRAVTIAELGDQNVFTKDYRSTINFNYFN